MSVDHSIIERLPVVEATLNYLKPVSRKPRTYTFDPPPGEPKTNVEDDPRTQLIHDVRPVSPSLSLDKDGFELLRQHSAVRDFYDEDEVRSVYYAEAEDLLKRLTGAAKVVVFDHTLRHRVTGAADRTRGAPRQPAGRIHVDQTATSGPQRVRHELPEDAEELLRGRAQIINLWRPIRGPCWDAPLAVCSASSVADEDLVASDLVFPDRVGETYALTFNPAHQWFYVPGMQVDEVLLLKCYDSATDGRARFVPHSAFVDPTTPPDAAPRESIELRAMVFHAA